LIVFHTQHQSALTPKIEQPFLKLLKPE